MSAALEGRDESVKADRKAIPGVCVRVLEVMEDVVLPAIAAPGEEGVEVRWWADSSKNFQTKCPIFLFFGGERNLALQGARLEWVRYPARGRTNH
jgi:hypothetical protein